MEIKGKGLLSEDCAVVDLRDGGSLFRRSVLHDSAYGSTGHPRPEGLPLRKWVASHFTIYRFYYQTTRSTRRNKAPPQPQPRAHLNTYVSEFSRLDYNPTNGLGSNRKARFGRRFSACGNGGLYIF